MTLSLRTLALCTALVAIASRPRPLLAQSMPAEFEDETTAETHGEPHGEEHGAAMPSTLPGDASIDLPEWQVDDLREFELNEAPTNLGGGLWPFELWPLMPTPKRLPASTNPAPVLGASAPVDGAVLEPIPALLNDVYFGKLPPEKVLDPQSLLNEVQQEDLGRFFEEYTSRQAGVEVRFLVIGAQQEVPPETQLQALTDRWFPNKQGLVVVYPMGHPRAAKASFSKTLQTTYSPTQLQAVPEACLKEAMFATREEDQLSRYGIKLAVRLNRLREEPAPPTPVTIATAPDTFVWTTRHSLAVGALMLAGGLAGWLWWKKRHLLATTAPHQREVWLLPDQEMTTRLSAPHSGGTMAILKFR